MGCICLGMTVLVVHSVELLEMMHERTEVVQLAQ
jgi:hypothetical protein